MSEYIFLFDLDSTVTKEEILPTISRNIGKDEEMKKLTEATMNGEIPFKTSFLSRVEILKTIRVSAVKSMINKISLNTNIANFIKENNERCFIVTGNLDVWICDLMYKLKIENHVFCSKAIEVDDKIVQVVSVLDKELVARQFVQPIVVIGDGDNDSGMAALADIAIGFGGVRNLAPSLIRNVDYAFYDDFRCASFLRQLL